MDVISYVLLCGMSAWTKSFTVSVSDRAVSFSSGYIHLCDMSVWTKSFTTSIADRAVLFSSSYILLCDMSVRTKSFAESIADRPVSFSSSYIYFCAIRLHGQSRSLCKSSLIQVRPQLDRHERAAVGARQPDDPLRQVRPHLPGRAAQPLQEDHAHRGDLARADAVPPAGVPADGEEHAP